LVLWRRSDLRDELWRFRTARAAASRTAAVAAPAVRPVVCRRDRDYADMVVGAGADKRHAEIAANPRITTDDPVLESWVRLVQENLVDRPLVFFTGTYSDAYGMSHGLMLPRNVQADFKRALKRAGLGDRAYINAVEPHRLRSVLHCHALVEATESEATLLRHVWDERGWSSAPECTDGGVSYCCKYALKSSTADAFDWRW
jgi:hypothetical protein